MSRVPRLLFALALGALAVVGPTPDRAAADAGLTATVAAAYFLRFEDAELHAIAHERAAEIAACECLDHDGMQAGTAEVLGYNEGYPDPVARIVLTWATSPAHDALLSDRSYGRIGCADRVVDGRHWFVCVLADGPLPAQPPAAPPVVLLPNTALSPP